MPSFGPITPFFSEGELLETLPLTQENNGWVTGYPQKGILLVDEYDPVPIVHVKDAKVRGNSAHISVKLIFLKKAFGGLRDNVVEWKVRGQISFTKIQKGREN